MTIKSKAYKLLHQECTHLLLAIKIYQKHHMGTHSAALAYAALFSVLPILMLITAAFGAALPHHMAGYSLEQHLLMLIEPHISKPVLLAFKQFLKILHQRHLQATCLSILLLFYASSRVFLSLRLSIQMVFTHSSATGQNQRAPKQNQTQNSIFNDIKNILSKNIYSLFLVFCSLLMMLALLITQIALYALNSSLKHSFLLQPLIERTSSIWIHTMGWLSHMGVFLFIYRVIAQVSIPFKRLLSGALLATILFELSKQCLSVYFNTMGVSNAYGLLSGILAFLLWIDISSRLVLFSAAWMATPESQ